MNDAPPVRTVRAALDGRLERAPSSSTDALVLAPPGADAGEVPGRLLASLAPVNLLGIGLNAGDARFARLCRSYLDDPPVGVGVVDVGGDGTGIELPDDRVLGVAEPSDLTGIGVATTKCLRTLDDDCPTVAYIDDLTPLIEFVELDRGTRFLELTTDSFERSCAFSVASVNPLAHDDEVLDRLASVFDVVVEADDGWTVRLP